MRTFLTLGVIVAAACSGSAGSGGDGGACQVSMCPDLGGASLDLACSGAGCSPADLACSGAGCSPTDLGCPPVACGVSMVDTCTSATNCGGCGHDCQGGACQAGVCQGTPVVMTLATPWDVAVDATNVYWTSLDTVTPANGRVQTAAKSGGAVTPLASAQGDPEQILLTSSGLFWETLLGGEIWKAAPPLSGTPGAIVTEPSQMVVFAVDGTNAYFVEKGSTVIRKAPLAGGGPVTAVTQVVAGVKPGRLTTDGAFVYWINANDGTVFKTSVNGGAATTLAPAAGAGIVALVGTDLYFSTTTSIQKMPSSGAAGPAPAVTGLTQGPTALAVDADGAYWTHNNLGTVWRARFSDGVPRQIAAGQNHPQGITTDATAIYWASFGDAGMTNGAIVRAMK